MTAIHFARAACGLSLAIAANLAQAAVINFDAQGLTGPSTYAAAGANRDLQFSTADPAAVTFVTTGGNVSLTGGTVLTQETFLPANRTSLYGTAFFASPIAQNPTASGYKPTVTLTFDTPVTSFYLDVYNGQTFNVTYTVADNNGHSASFLLVPNMSSGTTQIGFNPANATQVTITSDAGNFWDFSIDNIVFNEGLPNTIPTSNPTSPPNNPPVTNPPVLVSIDSPPVQQTPEAIQVVEQESHKRLRKGHDGDSRSLNCGSKKGFCAQGELENEIEPVPLPAGVLLFGSALPALVMMRRRRTAA